MNPEVRDELLSALGRILAIVVFVATLCWIMSRVSTITPEEERELEAEGAAAFDARVEAAGGFDRWLDNELAQIGGAR